MRRFVVSASTREVRGRGALALATPQDAQPVRSGRIGRYLFAAVLLLVVLPAGAQMNMLVVMTDDQRFDSLDKMPNIADMASQGVRFTNAIDAGHARATLSNGELSISVPKVDERRGLHLEIRID